MAKRSRSTAIESRSTTNRATRLLLVDDHALLRDGMRLMLTNEADLTVCGEAAGETEAVDAFRQLHPDLVILDISLKSGDGIEAIKRIRTHDAEARIIVSSMHEERIYGERALRAGAMGFVSKQAPGGTLLIAIRRVLAGQRYFGEELTQRLLHRAADTGNSDGASAIDLLADRELETFKLIGEGLGTREIASRMHISPKTVDRYRENIKKKLGIATSHELIHHATVWVEQNC
jgi:DNA-binding NarL/FixJ family response regulator